MRRVHHRWTERCWTFATAALLSSTLILLAACDSSTSVRADPEVDLFPVPVDEATSPFPSIDDSFLQVAFTRDFTFTFYGTTYSSIFLNTNGGFTFGSGNDDYDEAAEDIPQPGVGIFWGDMDAGEYEGENRPNQMRYRQFDDRFVITYNRLQDNDEETWDNTATVTLRRNGSITIQYGAVKSEDILVGVWNGAHTDNRTMTVQNAYSYSAAGTGILLFDYWETGTPHTGQLNNRTITFSP
jgi:hypothetical protein